MRSSTYGKLYEGAREDKAKLLAKLTGIDEDSAYEILDDHGWDMDSAVASMKGGKKKKSKDKKIFKVGDIVKCIDNHAGKNMPPDSIDFLLTYKKFKVKDVNDKLNIDIGHRLAENGNPYYFSPNRFELIDGVAPVKKAEPEKKAEPKPDAKPVVDKSGGVKEEEIQKKMTDWYKAFQSKIDDYGDKWED